MRFVSINNVKDGMILSHSLYNDQNKVLIRKGASLSSNIIEKLKNMGYNGLYIDDELTKDIIIEELISMKTCEYVENSLKTNNVYNTVKSAHMIVDELCEKNNIVFNLISTGDGRSRSIYSHSIRVCEYSVAIGKSLGYNTDKLVDLAVSALLHDIGKIIKGSKKSEFNNKLNDSIKKICNVSGNFKEYEELIHPLDGYNFLSNNPDIKSTTKQGILFHHEDEDSSGLLCKLMNINSSKIYQFAKIIHICDSYDHLVNEEFISPSEAYEFLNASSGIKFNSELIKLFQKNIPAYPVGVTVILSNGLNAVVCENNRNLPLRPKVLLEDGNLVNLENVLNVTIIGLDLYSRVLNNVK